MKLIPTNTKRNDIVQTPLVVAERIVRHFNPSGRILEPCKGEGAFMRFMPSAEWCEIVEGRDFMDYEGEVDWIITNPPFSKMRAFMQKAMDVSDNVVFLTSINHLWLKARLRDMKEKGFGIKEIIIMETPKTFPSSGFQIGCFYLKKGWNGDITFNQL